MKKTKKIAFIAIFTALYFVLSALLKIPVTEHITLDLGYIALTVGAAFMGCGPAAAIGGLGAFLESALMTQRGVSPGWIMMNIIVGAACGYVLSRTVDDGKKKFVISAAIVVPVSMLLGVAVKTLIDCVLYDLPLLAKIPTGFAAWLTDSLVMLLLGVPLCLSLKKQIAPLFK